MNEFIFDKEKCNLCLECEDICTKNNISFNDDLIVIDYSNCQFCESCCNICEEGALVLVMDYYNGCDGL